LMKFPRHSIELHEAAAKYGFTWGALRKAISRGRLKGFKAGSSWFTTRDAVQSYLRSRNVEKIPKSYRNK
jgi:hypothetical protein